MNIFLVVLFLLESIFITANASLCKGNGASFSSTSNSFDSVFSSSTCTSVEHFDSSYVCPACKYYEDLFSESYLIIFEKDVYFRWLQRFSKFISDKKNFDKIFYDEVLYKDEIALFNSLEKDDNLVSCEMKQEALFGIYLLKVFEKVENRVELEDALGNSFTSNTVNYNIIKKNYNWVFPVVKDFAIEEAIYSVNNGVETYSSFLSKWKSKIKYFLSLPDLLSQRLKLFFWNKTIPRNFRQQGAVPVQNPLLLRQIFNKHNLVFGAISEKDEISLAKFKLLEDEFLVALQQGTLKQIEEKVDFIFKRYSIATKEYYKTSSVLSSIEEQICSYKCKTKAYNIPIVSAYRLEELELAKNSLCVFKKNFLELWQQRFCDSLAQQPIGFALYLLNIKKTYDFDDYNPSNLAILERFELEEFLLALHPEFYGEPRFVIPWFEKFYDWMKRTCRTHSVFKKICMHTFNPNRIKKIELFQNQMFDFFKFPEKTRIDKSLEIFNQYKKTILAYYSSDDMIKAISEKVAKLEKPKDMISNKIKLEPINKK